MTIYQVFTRLFGAQNEVLTPGGTKAQNGCGTMADFTPKALREIKDLGINEFILWDPSCKYPSGSYNGDMSVETD